MVLKTVKYDRIENNSGNATHTELKVNYSIFGIVFYSKVYTRPIFNNYTLEIQKTKELIFAQEYQIRRLNQDLQDFKINTNGNTNNQQFEQNEKYVKQRIEQLAKNQQFKYEIWELGLKLEGKLKQELELRLALNTSQQKQANEQTKQDNQQIVSANNQQKEVNQQIISANNQQNKLYICANCAKTFDNPRKYAGHKTHCKNRCEV